MESASLQQKKSADTCPGNGPGQALPRGGGGGWQYNGYDNDKEDDDVTLPVDCA